jgi:hypothetical protein
MTNTPPMPRSSDDLDLRCPRAGRAAWYERLHWFLLLPVLMLFWWQIYATRNAPSMFSGSSIIFIVMALGLGVQQATRFIAFRIGERDILRRDYWVCPLCRGNLNHVDQIGRCASCERSFKRTDLISCWHACYDERKDTID